MESPDTISHEFTAADELLYNMRTKRIKDTARSSRTNSLDSVSSCIDLLKPSKFSKEKAIDFETLKSKLAIHGFTGVLNEAEVAKVKDVLLPEMQKKLLQKKMNDFVKNHLQNIKNSS